MQMLAQAQAVVDASINNLSDFAPGPVGVGSRKRRTPPLALLGGLLEGGASRPRNSQTRRGGAGHSAFERVGTLTLPKVP